MAPTPLEALQQLRLLYRNAHHISTAPVDDYSVIAWCSPPTLNIWATHQIRSRNWSFEAVQAVVHDARRLVRRAILAPLEENVLPAPVALAVPVALGTTP
jgi:hypothetical protein